MERKNEYEYCGCAGQIELAYCVITLSLQSIKSLFPGNVLSKVRYSYDSTEEIWLEVKFDLFTLTCLFDDRSICKGVFLDDLKDLAAYVNYCFQTYDYDSALKAWVAGGCCITIESEDETGSLAILPMNRG